MSFSPAELRQIAAELLAAAPNEVACRSAINRLYYACHLAARDALYGVDAEDVTRAGGRRPSHRSIIDDVEARLPSTVAARLRELKDLREAADYVTDDASPQVQTLLLHYGAANWEDLAAVASAKTDEILPQLSELPRASS